MAPASPALELKGRMLAATRIRVLKADAQAMAAELAALAERAPQAIKGMAAIIETDVAFDLSLFVKQLRAYGIQPIGVSTPELAEQASKLGLALLPKESPRAASAEPITAPVPAAPPPAPARKPARVVIEPVRSGQQIYAEGSDLIVLNQVSPGAEVIADGCIHIYGALRGRALAGAVGDRSARIFAQKFEAELVAVGGLYALTEQIKGVAKGTPAQAMLRDGQLVIEALV